MRENVVREMLLRDETLSNLEIASPALEDAFPCTDHFDFSLIIAAQDLSRMAAAIQPPAIQEDTMSTAPLVSIQSPRSRVSAHTVRTFAKEAKYEFLKLLRAEVIFAFGHRLSG